MIEDQLLKVATGLAFIGTGIFILRWFLNRSTGSPEEWAYSPHLNFAAETSQWRD